ncbi:MAG: glutathione-dependent formaldehyde dehydrogenase [Candidatus Babeliales bacterium]|nr:glutathione-dependent formaldehyde dehydrogenase [Candidatus Babeliales bacterium]
MKALVFRGIGNISLEEVKDPVIQDEKDVIVKITVSAICGTDLHLIRGTVQNMKTDTILGHEGVGIVEEVGSNVQKFKVGDRVIIPSTIGCGHCKYCKQEIYSQCDNANPNGKEAGTVYFGGPKESGPLNGMQAEKVLVPFADANLIKIPNDITDEQVILLSDILPTAYMAVENADIQPDDTVAVFGCGPVGQLVIECLKKYKHKKIFAIDRIKCRLEMAQKNGATIINFDEVDPVKELKNLTNGDGPTKVIDAVGIDAQQPQHGGIINYFKNYSLKKQFSQEVADVAPHRNEDYGNWVPGDGPSQVLQWAVDVVSKNGIISIIGVYVPALRFFPIGKAMGKNLTIRMGDCNHHKYIPKLIQWVQSGEFDSKKFVTQKLPFEMIVDAYKHFDKREDKWIKVILTLNGGEND